MEHSPGPQERIAVNKEVMGAVSNGALITRDGKYGMLKLWIDGCQRAGVKNFMVIAIDDDVRTVDMEGRGSGARANAAQGRSAVYQQRRVEVVSLKIRGIMPSLFIDAPLHIMAHIKTQ